MTVICILDLYVPFLYVGDVLKKTFSAKALTTNKIPISQFYLITIFKIKTIHDQCLDYILYSTGNRWQMLHKTRSYIYFSASFKILSIFRDIEHILFIAGFRDMLSVHVPNRSGLWWTFYGSCLRIYFHIWPNTGHIQIWIQYLLKFHTIWRLFIEK